MYRLQVRSQNGNLTGTCAPNIHIFTVEANHNTLHTTVLYYVISNAMWLWLRLYVSLFAFFSFFLFYALVCRACCAFTHVSCSVAVCARCVGLCCECGTHLCVRCIRQTTTMKYMYIEAQWEVAYSCLHTASELRFWRSRSPSPAKSSDVIMRRVLCTIDCRIDTRAAVVARSSMNVSPTALRACKKTNEWNIFAFFELQCAGGQSTCCSPKLNLSLPKYSGLQSTLFFLYCLIAL